MFLFIQDDKCKYKPELAAAFVKNVVNITAVSQLLKVYLVIYLFWFLHQVAKAKELVPKCRHKVTGQFKGLIGKNQNKGKLRFKKK